MLTPCFSVHYPTAKKNADAAINYARTMGVSLRPHVKTHKTVELAMLQHEGKKDKITVSTLSEARFYSEHGFKDIFYAVPFIHTKLPLLESLSPETTFHISVDQPGQLDQILKHITQPLNIFLEVDSGGIRSGKASDAEVFVRMAEEISRHKLARLSGVFTHGGHSYSARNAPDAKPALLDEIRSVSIVAQKLRKAGFEVPEVSIGSTPGLFHDVDYEEVTEIRPGNYIFYDLTQSDIGSCSENNISVTVTASVLGIYPEKNQLIIDAGALAMSKDRGATHLRDKITYGDIIGYPELSFSRLSQEHGVIELNSVPPETFSVGDTLRILPNHSCLTAACFPFYVMEEAPKDWAERIEPCRGW